MPNLAKYDDALPGGALGLRARQDGADTLSRRARRRPRPSQDDRDRHEQVPVGPVPSRPAHARSRPQRGAEGRALPRVRVRQPRFRPDRRAHQGRQRRTSSGSAPSGSTATCCSTRSRGSTTRRAATITSSRRRGRWPRRPRRRTGAVATHSSRSIRRSRQPGGGPVRDAVPRADGEGRHTLHERRHAGRRLVRGVADARGGGDRHQEPRRQGARAVAPEEPVQTIVGGSASTGRTTTGTTSRR